MKTEAAKRGALTPLFLLELVMTGKSFLHGAHDFDYASGVPTQGSTARQKTTDDMLVDECNRHLARRKTRIAIMLAFGGAFVLTLAFGMFSAHARSSFRGEPLPYSCDTVRTAVKAFTPEQLVKMARQFHVKVTPSQRREAQKCLAG